MDPCCQPSKSKLEAMLKSKVAAKISKLYFDQCLPWPQKCGCRHHSWVDIFISKRDIKKNTFKMAAILKSKMAAKISTFYF